MTEAKADIIFNVKREETARQREPQPAWNLSGYTSRYAQGQKVKENSRRKLKSFPKR
jgi:hypothetical protein